MIDSSIDIKGECKGDDWKANGRVTIKKTRPDSSYQAPSPQYSNPTKDEKEYNKELGDAQDRLKKQKKSHGKRERDLENANKEFSELADKLASSFSMNEQELYDLLRGYEKGEIKLDSIWEKISEEGKVLLKITSKNELERRLKNEWCPIRHKVGKTKWHKGHSQEYVEKREKKVKKLKKNKNKEND
jgi:hypothetical protein